MTINLGIEPAAITIKLDAEEQVMMLGCFETWHLQCF
jgi:hypothetical protein